MVRKSQHKVLRCEKYPFLFENTNSIRALAHLFKIKDKRKKLCHEPVEGTKVNKTAFSNYQIFKFSNHHINFSSSSSYTLC